MYCVSHFTQVYVVLGGLDTNYEKTSSTEQLRRGDSSWRQSRPLPRPLFALAAVTLDNIIYFTGGEDDGFRDREEIYQLDSSSNTWKEVARMETPRWGHGMSVIKFEEVEQFCS